LSSGYLLVTGHHRLGAILIRKTRIAVKHKKRIARIFLHAPKFGQAAQSCPHGLGVFRRQVPADGPPNCRAVLRHCLICCPELRQKPYQSIAWPGISAAAYTGAARLAMAQ
jgi:hypothetical protein